MSTPTRIWLALAVLYVVFFYWYRPFGGSLTDEEIARYTEVIAASDVPPERLRVWVDFKESRGRSRCAGQDLLVRMSTMGGQRDQLPPDSPLRH